MSELFEYINSAIKSQPFSALIGAKLTALEKGRAELVLPVKDELKQQHGFVHGGVVSYLADNCLTCAGASVLGDCVTLEYKINYARPAIGHTLVSKAIVLSFGRRQAVCECKVYAISEEQEKLVAAAQGTISKI